MKKFDAKQEALHMIEWIRAWFEANGRTATAVIGIPRLRQSFCVRRWGHSVYSAC